MKSLLLDTLTGTLANSRIGYSLIWKYTQFLKWQTQNIKKPKLTSQHNSHWPAQMKVPTPKIDSKHALKPSLELAAQIKKKWKHIAGATEETADRKKRIICQEILKEWTTRTERVKSKGEGAMILVRKKLFSDIDECFSYHRGNDCF